MTRVALDAKSITRIAVEGLQDTKGRDIVRMDLRKSSGAVTDFFIICTGTSDTHVKSLAESVMKKMSENGEKPISREGVQKGEWVLIDYGNVVIHIFLKESRMFYRLEDLWGDADFLHIPD
ncbi:MAG: ribosome silencing factor [Bacteroidetes bacterium]|jgi:ribosome-associated protein|nr:MAG: ribosome silencing factor [Bacteroidota bacterium]